MGTQKGKAGCIDRRQFLKYSGLLGIGFAAGGLMPVSESLAFNRRLQKVTRARLAMGTFVAITVMDSSREKAEDAIGKALAEMDRVSRILDRYKSSSAVGTLNRDGYMRDIPPEVSEVIARSLDIHKKSGGAFDITVQPLVDLYKKYFAENKTPPPESVVAKTLSLVDAGALEFDGRSIRFSRDGMGITLDGIAKGYIIDCGARVIRGSGIKHALINAGGDIYAIGTKNGKSPWRVGVESPKKDGTYISKIAVANKAIATSGNYEIYFDKEKLYHHIVNPKTGESPHGSSSVTVLARNAADADALATAVFVLQPRAGKDFIEKTPQTECLILTSRKEKVFSSGWRSA